MRVGWKERALILLVLLCLVGTGVHALVQVYPARETCEGCRVGVARTFTFGCCVCTGGCGNTNRICPSCGKGWTSWESRTLRQTIDSCLGPFR